MLGKNHIVTSEVIATSCMIYSKNIHYNISTFNDLAFIFATGLGSLIPDCDSKKSLINKRLPINLSFIFTHRGITHTLIGLIIFGLLDDILITGISKFWQNQILYSIGHGLLFGYFLHLVEDSLSQAGINWCYPFTPYDNFIWKRNHVLVCKPSYYKNNRPIRHWWGRGYKTGGKFERNLNKFLKGILPLLLVIYLLEK